MGGLGVERLHPSTQRTARRNGTPGAPPVAPVVRSAQVHAGSLAIGVTHFLISSTARRERRYLQHASECGAPYSLPANLRKASSTRATRSGSRGECLIDHFMPSKSAAARPWRSRSLQLQPAQSMVSRSSWTHVSSRSHGSSCASSGDSRNAVRVLAGSTAAQDAASRAIFFARSARPSALRVLRMVGAQATPLPRQHRVTPR